MLYKLVLFIWFQLYPAVIENVHQAGSTVVVTFIEYGNQEEVLMEDLMPIQQQGWVGSLIT